MKTPIHRVRQNGSAKLATPQAQIRTPAGPAPELRIASEPGSPARLNVSLFDLRDKAATTFVELQRSAAAAIALAMMNANLIKEDQKANAGWEDLDSDNFRIGNLELPRLLGDSFNRSFSTWKNKMDDAVQKSERTENPCDHSPLIAACEVENAVNALKHLVDLQGREISNRNNDCSFACSFLVMAHLESAHDEAFAAFNKLRHALVGQELPQAA